ncbi:superoxide dismutase [Thermus thermophilus]|uniref:Superoxide dismutase n=2 Tax=Thermus thermophilus TaxID=274 RepID=A0A3P4AQR4_THETH|nr:superoxide dismutase [Thermus thermophilus]AFH39396.1 superoxide dismutase [Thermus thermophilus JL-18]VCU53461.1 Superoxide dismutase [Mn] [Thermus thermophilus]BBL81801.1 superoxide dismutase [Mn] [Thermus thermophilus]BBL84103.1 superoxide dismutase [Mn] [Thermus thermophilus]BCZ86407.1 superoxide dismutase [Mn] [Thermus thermophilus]
MPYPFKLPDLGYPYEALEPHIDAKTMEIHHQKHHGAYVNNLNAALEKYPYLHGVEVEVLLRHLAALPQDIQTAVRNNGGGHLNHSLFWRLLTPGGAKEPVGELKKAIDEQFGGFQALKEKLTQAAMGRFGSGWAWLVKDPFGKLHVLSTPNQDNPVMEGFTPIVGIDVWEHAYYLKYQNRRADYLQAIWNVLNWDVAEEFFKKA